MAELPKTSGGFGHTSPVTLAPCAYLASVRATQHDPLLAERLNQLALRTYTEPAYDALDLLLDCPLDAYPDVLKVIPTSAAALALAAGLELSSNNRYKTPKKIQAAIYAAVSSTARTRLRASVMPPPSCTSDHLKAVAVHVHLITARSQQSRMMTGSMWFDSNVVESELFVHFARYYLGLLALLKPWCPAVPSTHWEGKQSVCMAGHEAPCLLEPGCSHLIACPGSYGARHAAHERINKVFGAFVCEAGAPALLNPSTRVMMGDNVSDEAARLLYPKVPSAAAKQRAAVLQSAFHVAATSSEGPAKEAAIACIREMTNACSAKQRGLRVDCIAELPKTPLWIDVGIIHPEARSKLAQSLAFVRQHDVAERAGSRSNNAFMGKSSPPVQSYVAVKDAKYKAMVEEATSQVGKGTRQHAPVLAACIFSHLGELSSVAIRTIEVITLAYRAMVARCYFEDGVSLKRRTAEFRMRFKDALMCANAAGFGRTISQAGKPRAGRAVTSPDANSGFPDWEILY